MSDIQEYINLILQKKNVFLNSPGGCGKSYILKVVHSYMRDNYPHIKIGLTSSTGVSAVNISGVTLHHYTGIGLGKYDVDTHISYILKNKKIYKKWRNTDYIFIDEISMLGGSILDKLNEIGKKLRNNNDPFGGIKLFVSGDNMQLSPINDYWFFQSSVWNDMEFIIIRNFTPYRYPDLEWFKMLMRIRVGKLKKSDIKKLKSRIIHEKEEHTTLLYPKNKDVLLENTLQLNKLPSSIVVFDCIDFVTTKDEHKSTNHVVSTDKKYLCYTKIMNDSVPQQLELKVGAECIITFNVDVSLGLANGTRCIIDRIVLPNHKFGKNNDDIIESGGVYVVINSEKHFIKYTQFTLEDDEIIYSRYQIPLKIAYALTVHKCQGLSLPSVCTSIGSDIFCAGQAYVALSRCKQLDQLYLLEFDPSKIIIDQDALEFENFVSE